MAVRCFIVTKTLFLRCLESVMLSGLSFLTFLSPFVQKNTCKIYTFSQWHASHNDMRHICKNDSLQLSPPLIGSRVFFCRNKQTKKRTHTHTKRNESFVLLLRINSASREEKCEKLPPPCLSTSQTRMPGTARTLAARTGAHTNTRTFSCTLTQSLSVW